MENVSTKINPYILSLYEYDMNLLNYRAYHYSNPFFMYVEAYIFKKNKLKKKTLLKFFEIMLYYLNFFLNLYNIVYISYIYKNTNQWNSIST